MTINQALKSALAIFKKQTLDSALLDAQILLAFVLKKTKEYLFTYPEKTLTKNQAARFKTLIKQRTAGRPIAYLTHHKEFYGLDFYVNRSVLIPRPDTELLVSETIKLVTAGRDRQPTNINIAEIGTGSGAIAVAITVSVGHTRPLPAANIFATDISAKALTVAQKNARLHHAKIKFLHGNLLEPLKNQKIDILIANLPYLPTSNIKGLVTLSSVEGRQKSFDTIGLKFEPHTALYSGPDGLNAYREFFHQAAKLKHQPKFILIEFDPRQTPTLKKIIKTIFPTSKIQVKKDLCGLDRVMIVKIV
ncbi:TPA: peptide chain release factor N(5)-glutamine methyltransferase [Candidatus Falkowbacteria bacterium]|nr:peptide chain release factor N(5)-glutamine methyltransferase [Candidatus Falkowbacteria bacterium]